MSRATDPETLLSEAAWLRRLAGQLGNDHDDVDDLVQDAWITAWRKQPDGAQSLRPWLAKVVRDGARMLRRGRARRQARDASAVVDGATASAEELLAQARLHRLIVEQVLDLPEPYRATILARFVDGQSAAAQARATGVPEGTVRWRQAEAIRRLRVALDAAAARRAWSLVATAGAPAIWNSKVKVGLVAVGIAAVALLALLAIGLVGRGGRGSGPMPTGGADGADGRRARGVTSGGNGGAIVDEAPAWLDRAAAAAVIAGHVVDERGAPIAGATVVLEGWAAILAGEAEARTVTDRAGGFRLAPRWADDYVVTASAPQRVAASARVDPRAPGDGGDPSSVVLVLAGCDQTAEGTITDAGGGPIEGAVVRRVADRVGRFGAGASADADGHFTLCLPRGAGWLEIGADGYEHVLREVIIRGRQRLDVALAPAARVRGRVVDAVTGVAIAGVQIGVWPVVRRSGEAAERGARSAADGGFVIDGVAAGRFQLTAWARDHAKVVLDEVVVQAATDGPPLVVRLQPGVTVRGVARVGVAPVVGARIWLEQPSSLVPITSSNAVTDAAGAFALHGVPAVAGMVVRVAAYRVETPVVVDARVAVTGLTVQVATLSEVRGRVVRDGTAVADAEVIATGATGRRSTRSDPRGEFRFGGLPAGGYELFAASSAAGAFSTTPVAVTVPGAPAVVLELDGGGAIDGRVIDVAGAPVVGARVSATHLRDDDSGAATTAVDGSFAIDALRGGDYRLRVDPFAGAAGALAWVGAGPGIIAVADGHARVGPITLRVVHDERPISGIVVDADGALVADAFVRLGPVWGASVGVPMARTDESGRFRLIAVGAGPFTLDAGTGGGPSAVARDVPAGATDVELRLVQPSAIAGVVVGAVATRVWLQRRGGFGGAAGAVATRSTQPDGGRFRFDGLVPGPHVVTAIGETGAIATAEVEVVDGAVATVTLRSSPSRAINGHVTRVGDGAPVAGVTCVAAPALGDLRPPGLNGGVPGAATTDGAGRFTIERGPVGAALVVCLPRTGTSAGAVRIGPDDDAHVEVAIVPPRRPGSIGFWLDQQQVGAVVAGVVAGAATVGIARGDRVVAIAGVDVAGLCADAVYWLIAGRPYGTSVPVTFARGAVRSTTVVTISVPQG